ncbi:MAG: hypothetical protein KAY82_00700 [Hylemonella sp.]|nr:hypothetical protein [Hylemonella sp.]
MRVLVFTILMATQAVNASTTSAVMAPNAGASTPALPVTNNVGCDNDILKTHDILGQWRVEWPDKLAGEPSDARLVFALNPEFADSLLGLMDLGHKRHEIAGDIEESLLTLEESSDGKSISANWSLRAVAGRCGKELTGTWVRASDGKQRQVVLRRPAKW